MRPIMLILTRLTAGKVHGSLARAGKVRGQTPKVQKQDKKKQPKGRAMKRIKYNRRFVNVGEFIKPRSLAEWPLQHRPRAACYGVAYVQFSPHLLATQGNVGCEQVVPIPRSSAMLRMYGFCAVVGFGKKKGPNSQ